MAGKGRRVQTGVLNPNPSARAQRRHAKDYAKRGQLSTFKPSWVSGAQKQVSREALGR